MKKKDSSVKPYKGSSGYKPGYSINGSSMYHSSSTTQMLRGQTHVDMNDSQENLLSDAQYNSTTATSTFSPTPPVSPAVVYTPPTPSYLNTVQNSHYKSAPLKPAPMRNAPQRPPARKAPQAPKPASVSANIQNESSQHSPVQHGFAPSAILHNGTSATHHKPPPLIPPTKPTSAQKLPPLIPPSANKPTKPPAPQLRPAPSAPPKAEKSTGNTKSPPLVPSGTNKPIKSDITPQLRPAPMAPPKTEKPTIKPIPSSKHAPAPKPVPVSASTDSVPAPKPKPKYKPPVTAEKPAVKPEGIVPPKPATKPAGLDSGLNKPHPGNSLLQ